MSNEIRLKRAALSGEEIYFSKEKPTQTKALKAALMPRLGISYLLARLIIPSKFRSRGKETLRMGHRDRAVFPTERERLDKES